VHSWGGDSSAHKIFFLFIRWLQLLFVSFNTRKGTVLTNLCNSEISGLVCHHMSQDSGFANQGWKIGPKKPRFLGFYKLVVGFISYYILIHNLIVIFEFQLIISFVLFTHKRVYNTFFLGCNFVHGAHWTKNLRNL